MLYGKTASLPLPQLNRWTKSGDVLFPHFFAKYRKVLRSIWSDEWTVLNVRSVFNFFFFRFFPAQVKLHLYESHWIWLNTINFLKCGRSSVNNNGSGSVKSFLTHFIFIFSEESLFVCCYIKYLRTLTSFRADLVNERKPTNKWMNEW